MKLAALSTVIATAVLAIAATHGCGPPCADDRCSLSPAQPQVTRVDYTKKNGSSTTGSGSSATPGTGSAMPAGSGTAIAGSATAGSAAGSAAPTGSATPPVATGSGSAKPATGSGSAAPVTPPPPSTSAASWERDAADQFKMTLTSKQSIPANTTIRVEQVKTPTKTPYVITLQVKPAGGSPGPEAAWNDCPENKIVCDPGTKTHSTKKPGVVLLQAGINWAITAVTDDGKGTLVTWTNNLSREVLQLRLSK